MHGKKQNVDLLAERERERGREIEREGGGGRKIERGREGEREKINFI